MAQYPPARFDLDDDEASIRDLQFTCNRHSDTSQWLSPVGHKGTLKICSKTHPLQMNYIAQDRGSMLVRLNDELLHSVLTQIENKAKKASPMPALTMALINKDETGRYCDSLKLKCAYTQWVDAETGDKMSAEDALSSKGNRLTSWCIDVYRLNCFRGKWYFSVLLRSAKVASGASQAGKRKREDGEDYTQYL
jgi:hypothetical protein